MFVFDRAMNFYSSSIVAAAPAIAAGVAWALKRKGSTQRVWCFIGDGAEDEGHFYEAARYVDGWDLPCMFIIEDNDRNVVASKRERRGNDRFDWPNCVQRYTYMSTYPHGGTGTPGWLKFKSEAQIVTHPLANGGFVLSWHETIKTDNYFAAVRQSCESLAAGGAIFIGYNVKYGGAYGTFKEIPDDLKIETPLAENLMLGLGMGMSLEGFRPVVFFERHEFLMNAMDALVNTLDVIETISDGEYRMPVIIKAVAGGIKPFYAGLTHTRNFADEIRALVHFPVYAPETGQEVLTAYTLAQKAQGPVMISEKKELY